MNALVQLLKALADETRFRIVDLLLTHDLCVGALATRLSISKAAVSQHLQILRKAGLVSGEKRGYWTHYSVNRDILHSIGERLTQRAGQAPGFRMAWHPSNEDEGKMDDAGNKGIAIWQERCQYLSQLQGRPEDPCPGQTRARHGGETNPSCVPKEKIR